MKAVRLNAYGDVDQFSYGEVPDLAPGEGEVLVKVEAASINPVDLWVRQGFLAQYIPFTMPAVIGIDFAGTVAGVGSGVTGFKAGDRVLGKLPPSDRGTHAEYTIAKPSQMAKLPANLNFAVGATLPLVGLTARNAVKALNLKAGDRVLVTGALGGVGRATIQYLKEIGAVPVAGVRKERLAEGKALAGEAIVEADAPKRTFDFAINNVPGPVGVAAAELVRDGGTLAAVSALPDGTNADGRITVLNIQGTDDAAVLQQIAEAASKGQLTIPIAKTYKLSELAEAHKLMAAGQVGGKIVIVP